MILACGEKAAVFSRRVFVRARNSILSPALSGEGRGSFTDTLREVWSNKTRKKNNHGSGRGEWGYK